MKAQVFLAVGRYFAGVRRVGLRRVFCLAALWLVACAQLGGQKPPAVAPNGTLSIAGADGAAGPAGPFRVVFSGPEGEVQAGSEISVMFSRPLRALELAGAETVPRIALSPNVSGRWQWIGTSALIFVPESGRLPSATRFTVEVPADLRALDGSTLGKPHRFEFQTARPKLVRSRPYAGEQGRVPATKIELFFNQPVDPKVVQRLGKLRATRAGKASSLAFEAARPDAAAARRIEVRPRNPLPVHSAIAFELEPSFVGQEGPLTADSPIKLEFHTYGPLVVERVTCSTDTPHRRCEPGRPLSIEFSNPVKLREVKRLLSVTPALKLRWES